MTSKTSNQKHGQGQGAWQRKKRPHVGDQQPCGAYNYRGCLESGSNCSFAHRYSIWAGTLYYSTLNPSEQAIKGLISNSWFPAEFRDLRYRNVNSLMENEQLELIRMPLLSSSTTAPHGDSKRRKKATKAMQDGFLKDMEVKLVDMENAANPTDDAESEVTQSMPTRQEREATLREEAEEAILERTLLVTTAAFRAKPKREVTNEERKAIADDVNAILNLRLTALEEEFALAEGVCYMQQERLESKDSQDDQVQFHRFGLVTPGALGVFNPDGPCNDFNKEHLVKLMKNLNELVKEDHEDRSDSIATYICRHCFRSLYRSSKERRVCACLRCVSVLYCCTECRDADVRDHKVYCFLHPAWECEESARRREAWLRAAGKTVKQPTEEEIPEMKAHDDPTPQKEDQLEDLRGGAVAGAAVQGDEDDAVEQSGKADDDAKTAGDGGDIDVMS
jgi:hypothetical protein